MVAAILHLQEGAGVALEMSTIWGAVSRTLMMSLTRMRSAR